MENLEIKMQRRIEINFYYKNVDMNVNLKMKTDEKISEQKIKSSGNDNNKIIGQYTQYEKFEVLEKYK